MKNKIYRHVHWALALICLAAASGAYARQEEHPRSIDLEVTASEAEQAKAQAQRCVEEFWSALGAGDASAAMKQVSLPFAFDRKKLVTGLEEMQAFVAVMAQKMSAARLELHVVDIRISKRIEESCVPVHVAVVTAKVGEEDDSMQLCVRFGASTSICGLSD